MILKYGSFDVEVKRPSRQARLTAAAHLVAETAFLLAEALSLCRLHPSIHAVILLAMVALVTQLQPHCPCVASLEAHLVASTRSRTW